jgi:broad specificity phosphatase PhoE
VIVFGVSPGCNHPGLSVNNVTIYLCRHGDTAWSPVRRLAGRTDIALTEQGEANARQLGRRLAGVWFDRAIVSPLIRARRTAELAGFATATVDDRLLEMNFGEYEGLKLDEIHQRRPGWTYLKDGCPGGETPDDLARRADALLSDLAGAGGTILLFGHSVILRVLSARYLGQPAGFGRHLMMSPGSVSVLGYDTVDLAPAIASWNDRHHVSGQAGLA